MIIKMPGPSSFMGNLSINSISLPNDQYEYGDNLRQSIGSSKYESGPVRVRFAIVRQIGKRRAPK
jgi:hypothetical protein